MQKSYYDIQRNSIQQYEFISVGPRGRIRKRIEFAPLKRKNLYNVALGDVMPDGSIDDTSNSNNQDIVKVLATVTIIMKNYLNEVPEAKLFFTGSTKQRTNLYYAILKRHYNEFSDLFIISGLVEKDGERIELTFECDVKRDYLGFFIRKKR